MKFNLREDVQSVLTALRRFRHAVIGNPQVLALMVLAVVTLAAVAVLYLSEERLHRGPWQTYEDGLFSIMESRDGQHFERFSVTPGFQRELESRCGGQLLCAYQKSIFADNGEVREIRHINVFSLSGRFSGRHALTPRDRAYESYLDGALPMLKGYEVKRLPDQNGHPALSYKDSTRDSEGYYSMGIVVCAHERAYFYEVYSHYSPYADWWNDQHTYFCPTGYGRSFSADSMSRIEARFLLLSMAMLALFLAVLLAVYDIFTRQVRRQHLPVTNALTWQHYGLALGTGVILALSMLVMIGSLWLFRGVNTLGLVGYVVTGLVQLCVVLPVLIHLYRKSRQ